MDGWRHTYRALAPRTLDMFLQPMETDLEEVSTVVAGGCPQALRVYQLQDEVVEVEVIEPPEGLVIILRPSHRQPYRS